MKRLLAAAVFVFAWEAHADVQVYGAASLPGTVQGIELALGVGRSLYDTELPGGESEIRANRLGLALYEPIRPWLQPGIEAGYLDVDRNNNPATAGMNLSGYYVGGLLRSEIFPEEPLGIQIGLSYTYHSVDGETELQDTRLEWYETQARLGGVLRTGPVEWVAGGYYRHVDGDETTEGALTHTTSFDVEERSGAYAGVDFLPDPSGRISLRFTGGPEEQISIAFSRRF